MSSGIKVYDPGVHTAVEYAGYDAMFDYFVPMADMNLALAKNILAFSYDKVLKDPIISYAQKAVINTAALTATEGSPAALAFHKAAMKQHGVADPDRPVRLGLMLRHEESNINAFNAGWTDDPETFHLAKVTTLAGMGPCHAKDLRDVLKESFNAVGYEKTSYAVNLVAVTHGFDAAEKAAAALQEIKPKLSR